MTTSRWPLCLLVCLSFGVWLTSQTLDLAQEQASAKAANSVEKSEASRKKPGPPRWHDNIKEWKAIDDPETADNSFCYVCHLNYDEEELTEIHLPYGVGCETCHGISDKHSEDEDSVTPPDVMFPKKHVSSFCAECH